MRNLDGTCLIEKLWPCRIHAIVNDPSVELVLLTARTPQVLSVLGAYSESVLFYLILHQLSVEESGISGRS